MLFCKHERDAYFGRNRSCRHYCLVFASNESSRRFQRINNWRHITESASERIIECCAFFIANGQNARRFSSGSTAIAHASATGDAFEPETGSPQT